MNVPKIRLAGFDGNWEKQQIGALGDTYSGLTGKSKSDFGQGDAQYITFLNVLTNAHIDTTAFERVDVKMRERQNVVHKGDILFNTSSETPEEVGLCSVLMEDIDNLYLNSFCFGFRPSENAINAEFLVYLMRSHAGRSIMKTLAQGATRYNLSKKRLCEATILVPASEHEQQRIAEYFKNLDSLIEATTKKIETLKQTKLACLQSMFPQPGEGKPRLRFKEYDDNWDVLPLSTFARKSTEKNTALEYNITLTNSAEYGVINQLDFFDHDISNDSHIDRYYVIHNDDFVYNPRVSTFAPVGPINRNTLGYSGVMSPLYLIFKVDDINKDFLAYFFKTTLWHQYMKLEGNTGARFDRLALSDSQFFNMPIYVPKQVKEQEDIASFFSNLDKQISLYEHRLEKLTNIKSACLDGMFI